MQVVIVGSGIAGISAAAVLSKSGVKVLIVEAQDRVGGRMHTVRSDGQVYDMGASWMHETLTNPLFKVAADLKIPMYYDDAKSSYFTKDGPVPPEENILAVSTEIHAKMRIDYGLGKYARPDMNIRDYAVDFVESWPLVSDRAKQLAPRYVQLWEMWNALSWLELPASSSFAEHFGRNAYMLDGYDSIYKWVWDQVDWTHVTLSKDEPVEAIEQGLVTTSQRKLECDYIICTVPLGPLKDITFGGLPQKLSSAIAGGTMGALGKVYLEFDDYFWDPSIDRQVFVVDKDPKLDPLPIEPGNHPVIFFAAVGRAKPALCCMTAPPLTEYVEAHPDKAFDLMRPGLEAIKLSGKQVLTPTKVLCTDWTTNKYFQGSYSAAKVDESYDGLIMPFVEGAGTLRFAGEHTVFEGTGCVHGAYLSGKREAEIILDDLNGTNKIDQI